MVPKVEAEKFEKFRTDSLANAGYLLRYSKLAQADKINNIAFTLAAFALEEIGKVEVAAMQLFSLYRKNRDYKEINWGIEDHVKKLFWAIWGPSFGKDKITSDQINRSRGLALMIHKRRLYSLYTDPENSVSPTDKIDGKELEDFIKFVEISLTISENRIFDLSQKEDEVLAWFLEATDDIEKRKLIFGPKSQEKLLELQNVKEWIQWLKQVFDENDVEIKKIIQKELQREEPKGEDREKFKWKVKVKVITPSHSLRNKTLNEFNKNSDFIKLNRGKDNNTLFIDMFFTKTMSIGALWDYGWAHVRLFILALNIGSHGFFWWNIPIDTEKFYEEIEDLENKDFKVSLEMNPRLRMNWKELRWVLREQNLRTTSIVLMYLLKNIHNRELHRPFEFYMTGLAFFAKNDIHLRFEVNSFDEFFKGFQSGIKTFTNLGSDTLEEAAIKAIGGMLESTDELKKIIALGLEFQQTHRTKQPITLKEIVAIKYYCDLLFVKIAANFFKEEVISTKTLHFQNHTASQILDGTKTIAIRFLEKHRPTVGEELILINSNTGEQFSNARVVSVEEMKLADIRNHIKKFEPDGNQALLEEFEAIQEGEIKEDAIITIVKFEVIKT